MVCEALAPSTQQTNNSVPRRKPQHVFLKERIPKNKIPETPELLPHTLATSGLSITGRKWQDYIKLHLPASGSEALPLRLPCSSQQVPTQMQLFPKYLRSCLASCSFQ